MDKNIEATLVAQNSYPDKFYTAYVERVARALISMARAARPTAWISVHPGETQ